MASLGEIVRAVGCEYLRARATTPFQQKALSAIARCRTETAGADLAYCDECGVQHLVYRSCGNRNCPGCQATARHKWLEAREQELLPVPYFHVVFTVPEVLDPIALYCPEVFYAALLRSAGKALLDVGKSKLRLELGCLTVLHTWAQNLTLHPHAHLVVPGGGFTANGGWKTLKGDYLLPIDVLANRFRTLLRTALRLAHREGLLARAPVNVLAAIQRASRQKWVVYAKAPFGGPEQVLGYLANYTHRIAISNSRIISFEDHAVTFRWRDSRDSNRSKIMKLDAIEFLRRFLMHVLPDGFIRIRYFGFMANAQRKRNLARARELIGCQPPSIRQHPSRRVLCAACYAAQFAKRAHAIRHNAEDRSPPEIRAA